MTEQHGVRYSKHMAEINELRAGTLGQVPAPAAIHVRVGPLKVHGSSADIPRPITKHYSAR